MTFTPHEAVLHGPESEDVVTRPPDRREVALPNGFLEAAGETLAHDFRGTRFFESSGPGRLGARAFARRGEVHFAKGEFDPRSRSGRRVIGHEMAHLAQQSRRDIPTTRREGAVGINDDHALESEADRLGARAASAMDSGASGPLGVTMRASPADSWGSASGSSTPAEFGATGAPAAGGVAQLEGGGWGDWLKSKFSGSHHYDRWHAVMPDSPTSADALGAHLAAHPAPLTGPASEGGTKSTVPFLGNVISTLFPKDRAIENVTVPGEHLLAPGSVRRSVESRNGMTGIRTVGDGMGLFPTLNNLLAGPMWGGYMAHNASMKLNPEYREQYEMHQDSQYW